MHASWGGGWTNEKLHFKALGVCAQENILLDTTWKYITHLNSLNLSPKKMNLEFQPENVLALIFVSVKVNREQSREIWLFVIIVWTEKKVKYQFDECITWRLNIDTSAGIKWTN